MSGTKFSRRSRKSYVKRPIIWSAPKHLQGSVGVCEVKGCRKSATAEHIGRDILERKVLVKYACSKHTRSLRAQVSKPGLDPQVCALADAEDAFEVELWSKNFQTESLSDMMNSISDARAYVFETLNSATWNELFPKAPKVAGVSLLTRSNGATTRVSAGGDIHAFVRFRSRKGVASVDMFVSRLVTKRVLLHELAHVAMGDLYNNSEDHGPKFIEVYLLLVKHFSSRQDSRHLAQVLRRYGVVFGN